MQLTYFGGLSLFFNTIPVHFDAFVPALHLNLRSLTNIHFHFLIFKCARWDKCVTVSEDCV
jgi:hypothetical protein